MKLSLLQLDLKLIQSPQIANIMTVHFTVSKRVHLSGVRCYISSSNLFTITNFSGWDPEIRMQDNKNGANSQGIVFDGSQYPQTRTFSAGISLNF